jgi:hypothetical protein
VKNDDQQLDDRLCQRPPRPDEVVARDGRLLCIARAAPIPAALSRALRRAACRVRRWTAARPAADRSADGRARPLTPFLDGVAASHNGKDQRTAHRTPCTCSCRTRGLARGRGRDLHWCQRGASCEHRSPTRRSTSPHATVATIAALALVMTGRFPASGIGRAVNRHRFRVPRAQQGGERGRTTSLMRCCIGDGGAGCSGSWSSAAALQGEAANHRNPAAIKSRGGERCGKGAP